MERTTRQRTAIWQVIQAAARPLSAAEILCAAQKAVPGLGIATIYRNVKALLEEGMVEGVTLPGEAPRYEPAHQAHHHHFQCTRCERVFDVFGCPGSLKHLAPAGFQVENHELTLYGRCVDC